MGLREVSWLTQDHKAIKWWSGNSTSGLLTLKHVKLSVLIQQIFTESLLYRHNPCPEELMALYSMAWQQWEWPGNSENDLWEVGLGDSWGISWGGGGLFCRKWETLEVFEQGSHLADVSSVWQRARGDGHLAREGREECCECGSELDQTWWLILSRHQNIIFILSSILADRSEPPPWPIQDNFLGKGPEPLCLLNSTCERSPIASRLWLPLPALDGGLCPWVSWTHCIRDKFNCSPSREIISHFPQLHSSGSGACDFPPHWCKLHSAAAGQHPPCNLFPHLPPLPTVFNFKNLE